MQNINLAKTIRNDINLIVTLYFLIKKRSLKLVTQELFIGQSAISQQLGKLRTIFKDELLVRTAKGMVPTPFAESIFPEVEAILIELEKIFVLQEESPAQLSPQKDIYRFCLPDNFHMNDISLLLFSFAKRENLPVTFEVFTRYEQCINDLNSGKIDFFFGNVHNLSKQIFAMPLVDVVYSFAVRPEHALAGRNVSEKSLNTFPYIDIIYQKQIAILTQQSFGDVIQDMQTVMRVSSATTAIHLIKQSDALCILPDEMIEVSGLARVSVKGKSLKLSSYTYWHRIIDRDPLHIYIREHLLPHYMKNGLFTPNTDIEINVPPPTGIS